MRNVFDPPPLMEISILFFEPFPKLSSKKNKNVGEIKRGRKGCSTKLPLPIQTTSCRTVTGEPWIPDRLRGVEEAAVRGGSAEAQGRDAELAAAPGRGTVTGVGARDLPGIGIPSY